MMGGGDHDFVPHTEEWWAPESEVIMLGEDGHGTWNPMFQDQDFQMFGEDGHGQWNPESWQDEEAGDQPWFEPTNGPSGDDMAGPSGSGRGFPSGMGGPSGDFGKQDMGEW